jgi:hypothetical protein
MSTQDDPRPAPEASAPRGLPRVVSIALLVVLVGTGLLAVQNCGGAESGPVPPPGAQPPAKTAPTANTALPPPEPLPLPPVT